MADSFTTFLQVRLPATGAYNNTWGATLNSDALNLLDTSITGWTVVNIASVVAFSLPALTSGSASISRFFSLLFTGTPPSQCTVTIPASVPGKMYLINNQTGQPLLFTYAGSTSTTVVANGELRLIWADGNNVFAVVANAASATSLGGIPTANWVRQSRTAAEVTANTPVTNSVSIPTAWPYATVTEAPTTVLDWTGGGTSTKGNRQILTLTGNRVMGAPVNMIDGAEIDLLVLQDGTGTRTLSWNAVFVFENGLAPVLGTAPGSIDRFNMVYNLGLNKWVVAHFGNINAGAGTTVPITISSNCLDWNLKAIVGTLGAPATLNILVTAGTVIEASSPGTPAMDLSGLISGCTINLTNLGYIQGRGGDGGDGALASYPGSGATVISAGNPLPGTMAIKGPGSGCTFNITNGAGFIWGGGGGGGGAGATNGNPTLGLGNGAGGGGGAGGGRPGRGARGVFITGGSVNASDGGAGTSGVNGTFGAAGASNAQGAGHVGLAGAGGDWGTVGGDGTVPSVVITGNTGAFSTGGAAGKAIELSGGAATFLSGAGSPNVKGLVT
jgi:hypothetical protein